jgi:Zn-dependent alcohol dehydrogenase
VRAAVLRSAGAGVEVEDVDLDAPHPGEVSVRVEAAGVCHTELHYMSGDIPCPLPVVLGHEGVGVVEEVGAGAGDIVAGERVAFTWRPRCGECEYCVTGRPVMCVYGRLQASTGGLMDGTSRLHRGDEEIHHFLGVSCFAERAVVSRRAVVPIAVDIPAAVAAVVGCAVVTGVGAVLNVAARQGSIAGRPLLVVGAGGVGLSAVMGAHLLGAAPVVAVDVSADKLQLARGRQGPRTDPGRGRRRGGGGRERLHTEAVVRRVKTRRDGNCRRAFLGKGRGLSAAQCSRAATKAPCWQPLWVVEPGRGPSPPARLVPDGTAALGTAGR